jgi:predicted  nucleic acid-binding Zn-ribbon protein
VNALRQLPEQVSAVAGDLAALRGDFTELKRDMAELRGNVSELRRDMSEVRNAFSDGHGGVINVREEFAAIRQEIRTGDEETRRQMRILHEEVISRLALLDEGRKTRRRRKP